MDPNLNPEEIAEKKDSIVNIDDEISAARKEIYHDILCIFQGDITFNELERMSMDELENLMASRADKGLHEMRDRIEVFNAMTNNLGENEEEKLLDHIFMNRLMDFNIFYQFISIFLDSCITPDKYTILQASLIPENKRLRYAIQIMNDEDHKAVMDYFSANPKFNFKNFEYGIYYSQNDKVISIEFIQH